MLVHYFDKSTEIWIVIRRKEVDRVGCEAIVWNFREVVVEICVVQVILELLNS
jgi:hypothetical protein